MWVPNLMAFGQEQLPKTSNFWQELSGTVDLTYTSRYMAYGYDFGGGQGAFQPSVTLDYHGWYLQFWTSFPDASGVVNGTELDYIFGYNKALFTDNWYETDATFSYIYFDYPLSDSKAGLDGWEDGQELSLSLSFPKLLSAIETSTFMPFCFMAYDWDGVQSGRNFDDGWLFDLGITYEFPIPSFLPHQKNQNASITIDTFYNDGAFGSSSGFSHGTVSVSTAIECFGFTLSPVLSFQSSWEDSVHPKNVLYGGVSASRTF